MKHVSTKSTIKTIGLLSAGILSIFALLFGTSFVAAVTTNTRLGIDAGVFGFAKDTSSDMDSYFGHIANAEADINIGTYNASLTVTNARSTAGDHRFTVSDMLGSSFTVTIESSVLAASGVPSILATAVSYTGTDRVGTGEALTATGAGPTTPVNIGSAQTFVARTNINGLSKFSQEITLFVEIPAAQAPASYVGTLTFTVI